MGASSPLTLSVDSVTALRGVAEQPSKAEQSNYQRFEVARRSRATKRGSVLRTAPREVGEQGIEP